MAYSAGRDSTALLHATLRAAAGRDLEVLALHVHHGLSVHADMWLTHAQDQCARWSQTEGWDLRFIARRLEGAPNSGDSVEAWAREARYLALAEMARSAGAGVILLAHHLRDQAETWMLQALRGAGPAGLACMPACTERHGMVWLRPWLGKSRDSIEHYIRHHRLAHVDDDSNDDPRFLRNRLRLQVWPALTGAFPDAEVCLGRSAAWAQQAADCLDELATQDLVRVAADEDGSLAIPAWRALSPARRGNVLRAWLLQRRLPDEQKAAPASLLMRLQQELDAGKGTAHWPVPGGTLRRHRGLLSWVTRSPPTRPPGQEVARETLLRILRAGRYALPGWRGVLEARRVKEGGIPVAWLAQLELRPRQGGERFQAGLDRPARSLKKQFQAADVPAWARAGPLVYSGGQLLFVPGLGVDARVIGLPGQPQMSLRWTEQGP